jgi:hypothetical protein
MFEGYAGTSDSGFRAEVESEQALNRGEFLIATIEAHDHDQMVGPAAGEATRRREDLGERASFQGMVVLEPARLRRLMTKYDPAIYPGKYITCVHTHTKALCEKAKRGGSEGLPDHGGCQPLLCHNVALSTGNITSWREEITRIDRRLNARPPLPPLLEHRLRARKTEILTFLDRHLPDQETS